MPDSEYFGEVSDFYGGVRLLILSVLRPSGKPWKGHMSTDEAARVISEVHPEKAIITHFGMLMMFKSPDREADLIERRTGVPTTAAKDGMHLTLGEEIHVGRPDKQADLSSFMQPS